MSLDAFLFTGIAGIKKHKRLEHLRRYVLSDVPAEHHEQTIPIIEITRLNRGDIEGDLFDLYRTYDERLKRFRTRIDSQSREIRCLFLHTHLTHFLTGHFRSWVGLLDPQTLFRDINLKLIVNLIDNVYACKHEVANDGYPHTLDQLITWRDNELMVSEILAGLTSPGKSVFDTCKVVSINHCIETAKKLIIDVGSHSLYLAYPISKIRDLRVLLSTYGDISLSNIDQEVAKFQIEEIAARFKKLIFSLKAEFDNSHTISEIEQKLLEQNHEYREFFGKYFVAYDPGTIDEMPLVLKLKDRGPETSVVLRSEDRWPLVCDAAMRLAGWDKLAELGQFELPAAEVRELSAPTTSDSRKFQTSIERQVRSRDFRLIEQSDGLIAYRPTFSGRWSASVRIEIDHVHRHLKRPFYVIKGRHDGELDEGVTLGWEFESAHWGEFDLSTPEKRNEAFETAKIALTRQIEDMRRC
jgi:hypothetical protein